MVLADDLDESELRSSESTRVVDIQSPTLRSGDHPPPIHLAPLDPHHTSNYHFHLSGGDIH